MELFEAIAKRHSYRGNFLKQPVPRADLQKIVAAGIRAPSGCNNQTTSFVMIDDPDLIQKIAQIAPKTFIQTAPALIVCVVNPTPLSREWSFALEDCAAAVENMLLAITALGYAAVWLDGFLREANRSQEIGRLLSVPPPLRVQVLLPVGVPEQQWPPKDRLPFERRAFFNSYGSTVTAGNRSANT